MDLRKLMVTAEENRKGHQIPAMVEFVRSGGFFTRDALDAWALDHDEEPSWLIKVSIFEDGNLFLHDGHHRATSIWCAGRRYLREDEYELKECKYSEYDEIEFLDPVGCHGRKKGDYMGWVTPFNISEETRLPDIWDFKEHVKRLYYEQGEEMATKYILENRNLYVKPREVYRVSELSDKYCGEIA